ncbi:glutamate-ammonia-ligase adenylyltransferase [Litorivivens lipolytica]|uniref:Bifunctional glutamine synthetase adenylyltransferase/adenylyl-removing enzyme n=1 Tax=Litorivivens lipolytica TaxID=1524264 RepID=A0A7W4W4J1_9GAMM|nr:bifunctional [glutamate--ammonia ligase]-adenylyl-L-tyrosine phosphorylase/[glutamate--ammonia-ligase] adenylyltransferase [Litorivivens lipolytica]MBB3047321.1 glutamate-ammonia-ligase adenylyltransferase [Litorivivens lipolytica]
MALLVDTVPELLREDATRNWQQLLEACSDEQRSWYENAVENTDFAQRLACVLAASQAWFELARQQPQAVIDLQAAGQLDADQPELAFDRELASAAELDKALRRFRNRHWLRIVWRDLNRLADTTATTRDLSLLADRCLQLALDYHHRELAAEWGEPHSRSGEPQRLVVIAMGKLGACELNLSSDIDLIFTYPESGETVGGVRQVDNQQFFIKLGQRLIASLDQRTADGFVFRMDMRLRPYGQSGPLVINFDAMEEYYQDQGREWERYAMIKARAVAGDIDAGERLLADLKPFVYRRYIDFSVIEALREMKGMIRREVKRRQLQDNIKLGSGGIREVEFIAQCFQLVRGGREPGLQERRLLVVLNELLELEQLPQDAVQELTVAYGFLRDSEHAIQAWLDRQTQHLPKEPKERAALAWVMGFDDWDAYYMALEQHRENVTAHFEAVIADPEESDEIELSERPWEDLLHSADHASLLAELEDAGFDEAEEIARLTLAMLEGGTVKRMQSIGRERLYDFLPRLLDACADAQLPGRCYLRILPLVEAVLRRTAYLVLLIENPGALSRLVRLCDASPWISRQLSRNPVLLDELLNEDTLYSVPDKDGLYSELRQQLLRIPGDDQEAQMEALRYFKLAHILRVAASEIVGTLPLMKVSDYLSAIAEVVLSHVLELAWQDIQARHGNLPGCEQELPFVVVAYGKLGGLELSYGSDLDLVFIHDLEGSAVSDGKRPVDGATFFTRLGQRMIHILNTNTGLGQLYEVDMRLRPSGNSGLLVSSFRAFEEYQRTSAWTWEHQALVRARVVAGGEGLAARFGELRANLLSQQRDEAALREEVVVMRDRMREHLSSDAAGKKNESFELKQGLGGIVDIEFMVQYAVLAQACRYPLLTRYTDNIRILESLQAEGLLSESQALALIDAYKTFRSFVHRSSLQEEKGVVPLAEVMEQRQQVLDQWQHWMVPGEA